jgi:general secretion pathway protein N
LNGEFDLVSKQVLSLAGRLIYSGGNVQFPVQRNQVDALLPMLIGEMGMEDDTAVMNVKTPEGKDIARVFLQADGWGGASMRKRAVDLVGQQWPDKQATEDTVIFEVSHKIL